jgi:hypothetical protein
VVHDPVVPMVRPVARFPPAAIHVTPVDGETLQLRFAVPPYAIGIEVGELSVMVGPVAEEVSAATFIVTYLVVERPFAKLLHMIPYCVVVKSGGVVHVPPFTLAVCPALRFPPAATHVVFAVGETVQVRLAVPPLAMVEVEVVRVTTGAPVGVVVTLVGSIHAP